jgi:glycosyltransferase involved in cell wall biosynthesis
MRVGFAITSLHGGGAEFTVRRWTDELCARGHGVYLYTYKPPHAPRELPAGAQHRHFPGGSRAARILGLPWWLRHQAERDELDVLVTMMTFANLTALVGLRFIHRSRIPVVISERNTLSIKLRLEGGNKFRLWLAQRLYRHANGVVAISHPVAADVIGSCRLDSGRTFVIPNPVTDVVAEHGNGRSVTHLHIAFVGRLVDVKRPYLFVDTIVELRRRGLAVKGTVIGEGPLRREAEAYAADSEAEVEFLGWREPWWSAVGNVDCLLHPSDEEGFANVLVEAAAAGIPAVARSEALGVADAIIPGVTGELALGSLPRDLADAVLRAVRPSGESMQQRWLEHFSVARSTELLEATLGHIVDEAP